MNFEKIYIIAASSPCFRKRFIFFSFILALLRLNAPGQSIWYVRSDATGQNNGASWADAFTDLQPAINAASLATTTPNRQIWVAAGVYKPTELAGNGTETRDKSFVLEEFIRIYGGLVGSEPSNYDLSLRNIRAYETVLSGDIGVMGDDADNSYHVMIIANSGAALDGFTIRGGNANGAGIINFQGRNFERSYCGGIYCRQSGNLSIANCIIESNSGINFGGIYGFSSQLNFVNCIVRNNIATGRGNNTGGAGGISIRSSDLTAINCLVTGNKGDDGGGIGQTTICSSTYVNCTISGNTALGLSGESNDNAQGGGINNYNYSSMQIRNCIIWGNKAREGDNLYNDPTSSYNIRNSIIEGGFTGMGNLDADPLFVNPIAAGAAPTAAGDYHILCSSPAINAGNNENYPAIAPLTDLDWNDRIVGTAIDMGAYEYQVSPSQNIVIQSISPGMPFSYCPGASMIVNFTIDDCPGNFLAGNVFTLQLSDANGNFASPVSLGSSASVEAGIINGILPANTPAGNNYKVRVVSSDQVFISEPFNISITVLSNHLPAISIIASATQICSGENVVFVSSISNAGANPLYQWKKNGNNTGTNNNTWSDDNLVDGDIITCELTNPEACPSPATVMSNSITITVTSITPVISIAADRNVICSGETVNFTASIGGEGSTPVLRWKKNGFNVGSNSTAYSDGGLVNGDIVACELSSSAACASPSNVLSNPLQINVNPVVAPAISIVADKNDVCPGDPVTFTATIANGGNNPAFQWKKNGLNVGTNDISYTDATLATSDLVACGLQSNAACASPQTANSNSLQVQVGLVTPTVVIHADKNEICEGETADFYATITEGGDFPFYQWKKNGVSVGGNAPTWSDTSLNGRDIISCSLTSSRGCLAQATVESNELSIFINPLPTITLSKSGDINCGIGYARLYANGGIKYEWEPADGIETLLISDPLVRPSQTTAYTVKVTTDKGCSKSGTITVGVSPNGEYSIPNSFTPNYDGRNDCFGIGHLLGVSDLQFSVFNRWGQRVFHTRDPGQCWNGQYMGKEQPAGVYVYVLTGKGVCGLLDKKGTVLLIR